MLSGIIADIAVIEELGKGLNCLRLWIIIAITGSWVVFD
jgi:hypothetical protein